MPVKRYQHKREGGDSIKSKHRGRFLLLLALLLLCCVPLEAHAEEQDYSHLSFPAEEDGSHGRLEITVTDAHEGIFLMGAGFRLYDCEGEPLIEGYTDAFGKLTISNLPCGDYSVRAFKAPKGYELDEAERLFSLTEAGETVSLSFRNLRRPGTIQVRKQNPDGSPCEGAAFLLEFSTDKGKHWRPVSSRLVGKSSFPSGGCTSPGLENGILTTNDRGIVRFTGLRADNHILYRVTELTDGGVLHVGTLPVESENIYANDAEVFDRKAFLYTLNVNAADGPIFRLPKAGSLGCAYLPPAMLLFAAPIIISTINLKKEKSS